LAHRDFRTLSGGERQRVLVAAALAQSSEVLLLDEPAAGLDLKHQVALYGLLRDLAERGTLVVAATHNLAMAARFAHRILLLYQGRVAAEGPPGEALTAEVVARVFEVDYVTAGLGGR
jgi:iron complex transport system ATP-binding protein